LREGKLAKISRNIGFIILSFFGSIGLIIVGLMISPVFADPFESVIISLLLVIGWQVTLLAYRHNTAMTSLEETLKLTSDLLNIKASFESVQNKHGSKKSFMIDLCKKKINELNDYFKNICDGKWVAVEPDEFTHKPSVFDVGRIQNFYAIATCGEEIGWFATQHGKAYLENIHEKIKENKKIQRLFIYKTKTDINVETEKFIQTNISKGYQIKILSHKAFAEIFWDKFNKQFRNDFGIYGNKLVWEKIQAPDDTTKVRILADDKTIQDYTEVFNKAWKDDVAIDLKMPDSITNFMKTA
jgi:hypothetical protein